MSLCEGPGIGGCKVLGHDLGRERWPMSARVSGSPVQEMGLHNMSCCLESRKRNARDTWSTHSTCVEPLRERLV